MITGNGVNLIMLKTQIDDARRSLNKLREEFRDEPELLSIYEPSALYLLDKLEKGLIESLNSEFGLNLNLKKKVDYWISLEGPEFDKGEGPIVSLGAFFSNFSKSIKQAMRTIAKKENYQITENGYPSFKLVDIAEGSLKIGLVNPNFIEDSIKQEELFEPSHKRIEQTEFNNLPGYGLDLLMRILQSTVNDEELNKLKENFSEKDILRLIYAAKELSPSARSNIEAIKFELKDEHENQKIIKVTVDTRRQLTEISSRFSPDKRWVEGKALFRQLDLDAFGATARPFIFDDNERHAELKCNFKETLSENELKKMLNKEVTIKGLLVIGNSDQYLRIEVDEFELLL